MTNILVTLIGAEDGPKVFVVPANKLATYPLEEMKGQDVNSNISLLASNSINELFNRTIFGTDDKDLAKYEYKRGLLNNVADVLVISWMP